MEEPLFPLALVPLAVGLVLIYVVIGSKNREENAKGLFCVSSRRSWSLPARWPSRDNSHDASRCGSASRLSVEASPRALCAIPRNQTATPGLKPMRHLEPWLPLSCAPRMIILANCFLLYSKAFDFWETYRLPSFLHEAPTGTQE